VTAGSTGLLGELSRWALAFAVAVLAHAAIALGLAAPADVEDEGAAAGGFVVELTAIPVARADVPDNVPLGSDQMEAAAAPQIKAEAPQVAEPPETAPGPASEDVEQSDVPPASDPQLNLPRQAILERAVAADQQPQEAQAPAPATSAAQAISDEKAATASAAVQALPKRAASYSLPTWKSKIETALERSKRYPAAAQARNQHGVVHVAFVIDREGRLVSSRISRGCGHAPLDEEALALLERAQPFPAPPDELPGARISLVVPIRFNLR